MNKTAYIVEGKSFEPQILKLLFSKLGSIAKNVEVIILPTCTNLYGLYKSLISDDGIDMIELAREILEKDNSKQSRDILNRLNTIKRDDIDDIYLFYDLDAHANNLPEGMDFIEYISKLINFFDNEQDKGKLYLSYPMAESIKWFTKKEVCVDECCFNISDGRSFKTRVSKNSILKRIDRITLDDICFMIKLFMHKVQCLLEINKNISLDNVKKCSNSINIFAAQCNKYIIPYKKVMILSAFPQHVIESYKKEYIIELFDNCFEWDNIKSCDESHAKNCKAIKGS